MANQNHDSGKSLPIDEPPVMISSQAETLRAKFLNRKRKYLQPALKEISQTFSGWLHSLEVQTRFPEFRIKDADRFVEKALFRNKGYKNPLIEITDQIGMRIVTYSSADIDRVYGAIIEDLVDREVFQHHETVDKRLEKSPDTGYAKVGYGSLHLILGLGKYTKIATDIKFEVQIRSILQDAWADIEHSLNYKADLGMPDDLRRRIYVLAGMLELADKEFDAVRLERNLIKKARVDAISEKNYEVGLSVESLDKYVQCSPIVESLARLIEDFPEDPFEKVMPRRSSSWNYILNSRQRSRVTTIRELDDFLQEALFSGKALRFVEALREANENIDKEKESPPVRRGFSGDIVNWLFLAKFPARSMLDTFDDYANEIEDKLHNVIVVKVGDQIFPESYEISEERWRADGDFE